MSIVILSLVGCVLMVSPMLRLDRYASWITLSGILLAIIGIPFPIPEMGMLAFTSAGDWWSTAVLTSAFLIVGLFRSNQKKPLQAEHYTLMVFAAVGALLLVRSQHLSTLFLGIEILSIPLFVLAAQSRSDRGYEAALKYFILGAFSSAVFVFGIGLYYSAAATLTLSADGINSTVGQLGVLLMGISLAFKVGLVPFHFWAPDVYDGSPTAITAFMATVAKLGGMAVFLQFIGIFNTVWGELISLLAGGSMLVGGLGALAQSTPKRMMAYGSIAQVGYWVLAGTNVTSAVYFGMAYAIGAILFLWVLSQTESTESHESISGLMKRNKGLALIAIISLFSMAGFPPFAGFFAKYWILQEMVQHHLTVNFYVGLVGAVFGISYYLKPIPTIFSYHNQTRVIPSTKLTFFALLAAFSLIVVGLLPLIPSQLLHSLM